MKKLLYIALLLTILGYGVTASKKPVINTKIDPNGEYTSGNLDINLNLTMVLDGQVDQKFHFEITKEQNETLKVFKKYRANLVPDPFRNDPKTFVPEKKGYNRIVHMRGLIFIILSKVTFYAFFLLGMAKVVFNFFPIKSKDYVKRKLNNKRINKKGHTKKRTTQYLILTFVQSLLICGASIMCGWITSLNKDNFSEVGRILSKQSLDLVKTMNETHYINKINSEKLRIESSQFSGEVFHIQNKVKAIIDMAKKHVDLSRKFKSNILSDTSLSRPASYIVIVCLSICIFFSTSYAVKHRKRNITMGLFFLTAFAGTTLIYTSGEHLGAAFMFTDICDELLILNTPGKSSGKGGLKNYIGCLDPDFQNIVTNELMNVLVGEQSLIKLLNNEITKLNTAHKDKQQVKNVTSSSDAVSRRFPEHYEAAEVFYRDQFIKLVNLTDIVKQKIVDVPSCSYLNEWGTNFYEKICYEGMQSSIILIVLSLLIAGALFLFAIFSFFVERFVVELQERGKAKRVQLYNRIPSSQEPIYFLNG